MKNTAFKIALSELLLISFVFSSVLPSHLYAEESTPADVPLTEEILLSSGSTLESEQIESASGTTNDSEYQSSSGVLTSTGDILEQSGETALSDNLEVPTNTGSTPIGQDIVPTSVLIDSGASLPAGEPQIVGESDELITTVDRGSTEYGVKTTTLSGGDQNFVEGELLIKFREENVDVDTFMGQYQISTIENANSIEVTSSIPEENVVVMTMTDNSLLQGLQSLDIGSLDEDSAEKNRENLENLIKNLSQDSRIEHVQKNFIYTPQSLPNDPDFSKLWALNNTGQLVEGVSGEVDADIDYPEAISYASGKLTTGVIVAVLDTGISDHADLLGNFWDGTNCKSDTGAIIGNCRYGYDMVDNDKNPFDEAIYTSYYGGHGTHVSGTIGAVTNNGTGMVGVSPNVKVMNVRVCGPGCTTSDVIRGINFAKHNGAKVINASFGGAKYVQSIHDFDFLYYDAIAGFPGLFIAAAGNDGAYTDTVKFFPSGFGSDTFVSGEVIIDNETPVLSGTILAATGLINVISVGASDQNDNLTSFSNYGYESVHIAAPGSNIYSTLPIATMASGITTPISYGNGWTRKVGASGSTWNTRSGAITSGEVIDISSVLWGDTRTPYVSGESSYIQKSFSNSGHDIGEIRISAWCDTPPEYYDRIDFLINTGGLFTPLGSVDESTLYWNGKNPSEIEIDGHVGVYSEYTFSSYAIDLANSTGSFDIRIKWVSNSEGTNNLGCFVKNIITSKRVLDLAYRSWGGTSMAAPHVAGAAALAWSYKPNATIDEVRSAIIGGGDVKYSLLGNVKSGARLNIYRMLRALDPIRVLSHKAKTLNARSVEVLTEGDNIDGITLSFASNSGAWDVGTNTGDTHPYVGIYGGTLDNNYGVSEVFIYNQNTNTGASLSGITLEVSPSLSGSRAFSGKLCLRDVGSTAICGQSGTTLGKTITQTGGTFVFTLSGLTQKNLTPSMLEGSSVTYDIYIENAPLWITGDDVKITVKSIGYTLGINSGTLDTSKNPSSTIRVAKNNVYIDTPYYLGGEMYSTGKIRTIIDDIDPDTTFYYKIDGCGILKCDDDYAKNIFTFRTPKVADRTLTSPINASGAIYLSGSTATGMIFSGSTASGRIVLINSGSTASITLPTQGLTITSSGTWDGILRNPELLSLTGTITLSGGSSTGVQSVHTIGGTGGVSLTLSGQLATISITLLGQSGVTLPVFRSPDVGLPYVQIGTCVVTNSLCTFTTNHFSLFALGAPVPPTTGGGGGGGGSTVITGNGGGGGTYNPIATLIGSSVGNMLYTPLQLNYMKGNGTTISLGNFALQYLGKGMLNLFNRDGMKVFLSNLVYSEDEDPIEFAREHITEPIISYIEDNSYTRGQKLIMYDKVLVSLSKQIKRGDANSDEILSLILAKKDIIKERKLFIEYEFSK